MRIQDRKLGFLDFDLGKGKECRFMNEVMSMDGHGWGESFLKSGE